MFGRDRQMKLLNRYKRLTLWNKIGVIGSLASIIGLLIYFIPSGIEDKLDKNMEASKEVKNLLLEMKRIERTASAELIKKYPLRYVLFAVDHKEIILPNEGSALNEFDFSWETARVIKLNRDEIMIQLPNMIHRKNNIIISNFTSGGKRKIGVLDRNGFAGVRIFTELLADDDAGIVALIGFRRSD
jgi:hypothetical protein